MKIRFLQIAYLLLLSSLHPIFAQPTQKEILEKEVIAIEKAFCDDLKTKGVAWAFTHYAAPDAVIKRERDTLILGKEGIGAYYSKTSYANATAEWKPDFVEVSGDGTLAYTYGKYAWTVKENDGTTKTFTGVFHTVWKRQHDGSWRYVWD